MLTAPSSSGHENGFKILQEQAAPAAFHNSKPRVDSPRCHPRTREAVLEELFDRVVGNMPRETWIAWLNGAAGAGKSAICQSFSEICIQRDIKVATFFFSRTDATRHTVDPVVATLVYQIIKLCPEQRSSSYTPLNRTHLFSSSRSQHRSTCLSRLPYAISMHPIRT